MEIKEEVVMKQKPCFEAIVKGSSGIIFSTIFYFFLVFVGFAISLDFLIILFILFPIFAFLIIFLLDFTLWYVKGQEIILITDTQFINYKKGKIFKSKRIIELNEIDDIYVKIVGYNLFEEIFFDARWYYDDTAIKVSYLGKTYCCGKNLSLKDAERICEILKKYITI